MFVYAQNAKGSSQPFVLKETLKAPSPSAKSAAAAASNGRGHNKHAGVEGNNIVTKMYLRYDEGVSIYISRIDE